MLHTACPGAYLYSSIRSDSSSSSSSSSSHRQLRARPVAAHRTAPHRIASQVPGLLPAFSLPLPPPITAASSSAIESSTQQATHVEHQRPASRTTQKQGTYTHPRSQPSVPWFPLPAQPPPSPASPPRAQGPRPKGVTSAPFLHSSKVSANIWLRYRTHRVNLTRERPLRVL
ncbi:hypothetical protein CSIM01_05055 [Colletotrichum simmondsii]|uniref:Uncharacterized protein n=1 Tax=Colletotrichum simmondsii TaxID=703756 RepID=A0A135SIE4_9PEZI|nr:hypothetical protein CSIM01_05055 [Colletotrichum simmondsii]